MNATEYCARVNERRAIELESVGSAPCGTQAEVAEIAVPLDTAETQLPDSANEVTMLTLVEMVLKNRRGLHHLLRNPVMHAVLLPRLLAMALSGIFLFGIIMSLVLTVSNRWPALSAISTWIDAPTSQLISFHAIDSTWGKLAPWLNGQAFVLAGAYAFGLAAASGIALPSLYFYCLLAGIRMTMLEVVVHAVKAKAIAAVALIGILPIYVAAAMGVVIFEVGSFWLHVTLILGLSLPFIAGVWGTVSLYQGFAQLCDTMPAGRVAARECFLRRLVLSWSVCYSTIVPVMIHTLWQVLSRS
jgi:hypothetical protein